MKEVYLKIVKENIKLYRLEAYFYEIRHPEIFNFFEQRRLKKEVDKIKGDFLMVKKNNIVCLDVGSGTGNVARYLTSANFEVVGSDLSIDMLKQNNSKHKVACESCYLPFKDNTFNIVTTYSVFHHLADSKKTLEEICRVSAEICTLYFDHDPFVKGKKIEFIRSVGMLAYFVWLLTKPKFLIRFFRYVLLNRKNLKLEKRINYTLTDENPVDTGEIIRIVKNHGFVIRVKDYGTGSLIIAKRKDVCSECF